MTATPKDDHAPDVVRDSAPEVETRRNPVLGLVLWVGRYRGFVVFRSFAVFICLWALFSLWGSSPLQLTLPDKVFDAMSRGIRS